MLPWSGRPVGDYSPARSPAVLGNGGVWVDVGKAAGSSNPAGGFAVSQEPRGIFGVPFVAGSLAGPASLIVLNLAPA